MLSVLIVNWNTKELLARCLHSLQENPPEAVPMEIIVVENDSSDGSAERVAQEFPNVKLIRATRNLGYAAGNNAAFARAQGEWLLTLNPDTEIGPGVLDAAVRGLQNRPGYGVWACQLVGLDGKVQASVRGFPSVIGVLGEALGLATRFTGSRWDSYRLSSFSYQESGPAPQPMGTFLLFRRSALAEIGNPARPFDEDFPIFYNEVDLLWRLRKAGWLCWFEASCQVRHVHGASTQQVRKSMIWESHRSLVRYAHKHGSWPVRLLMNFGGAAAIYLKALLRARGYDAGFRA